GGPIFRPNHTIDVVNIGKYNPHDFRRYFLKRIVRDFSGEPPSLTVAAPHDRDGLLDLIRVQKAHHQSSAVHSLRSLVRIAHSDRRQVEYRGFFRNGSAVRENAVGIKLQFHTPRYFKLIT